MLQATLQAEAALPAEVVVMLRKLAKKDSTTRLRGLSELLVLARDEARVADSLELLPHYVPAFFRLAADGARRVREQACVLLGALGKALGRGLAPHLRALLPPLLWASHDPAPEVCAAAADAFAQMLPNPAKRADALLFARKEIFVKSVANILQAAPAQLKPHKPLKGGGDKAEVAAEAEEAVERTLTSSLDALSSAVADIAAAHAAGTKGATAAAAAAELATYLEADAAPLLNDSVEVSESLPEVSENLPAGPAAIGRAARLRALLPKALQTEADARALAPLWDLMLASMGRPRLWLSSGVDPSPGLKKGAQADLSALVRAVCAHAISGCGAGGCAAVSYPSFLPFLALLPDGTAAAAGGAVAGGDGGAEERAVDLDVQ
ncbi:hypothetical protein T492DRAFT_888138, partial [Pavlovales sp. CCMP2436]